MTRRIHVAYTVEQPSAHGGFAEPGRRIVQTEGKIDADWLYNFEQLAKRDLAKDRGVDLSKSWMRVTVVSWQELEG